MAAPVFKTYADNGALQMDASAFVYGFVGKAIATTNEFFPSQFGTQAVAPHSVAAIRCSTHQVTLEQVAPVATPLNPEGLKNYAGGFVKNPNNDAVQVEVFLFRKYALLPDADSGLILRHPTTQVKTFDAAYPPLTIIGKQSISGWSSAAYNQNFGTAGAQADRAYLQYGTLNRQTGPYDPGNPSAGNFSLGQPNSGLLGVRSTPTGFEAQEVANTSFLGGYMTDGSIFDPIAGVLVANVKNCSQMSPVAPAGATVSGDYRQYSGSASSFVFPSFTATVNGATPISYLWYIPAEQIGPPVVRSGIGGNTSPTFSVRFDGMTTNGYYFGDTNCLITLSNGAALLARFSVTYQRG